MSDRCQNHAVLVRCKDADAKLLHHEISKYFVHEASGGELAATDSFPVVAFTNTATEVILDFKTKEGEILFTLVSVSIYVQIQFMYVRT